MKETRYHLRSGLLVGRPIWLPQGRDCHSPRTGTDLRMGRVAEILLGVCWLLVVLSSAHGQTRPSAGSAFVTVRSVDFDGTDSIPLSVTQIAQQRILAAAFTQSELVSQSTGWLRKVLYSYGYMEAVVDPPSVKPAEGRGGVVLRFHVEPGERYYISGLAVGGTKALAAQEIRDLIPFHPGDPVDGEKLDLALREIRRLYACSGYLDADPQLSENYHRATRTLFFTVQMHEGDQYNIASVKVLGLDAALADKLITLPDLQPNSAFSECRIREAIHSLWPAGGSSSEPSFGIRAERQLTPQKIDVVIDFSVGQTTQEELHAQSSLQQYWIRAEEIRCELRESLKRKSPTPCDFSKEWAV